MRGGAQLKLHLLSLIDFLVSLIKYLAFATEKNYLIFQNPAYHHQCSAHIKGKYYLLQPQDFSLSYDSQKLFVEIAFVGRKSRKWLFSSKLRNYFGRRSAKLGIG